MWVVLDGRVGILTSFDLDTFTGEVHLVNNVGETTLVLAGAKLGDLRQALLSEIPEQRRPSQRIGYALGYGQQSHGENLLMAARRSMRKIFRGK